MAAASSLTLFAHVCSRPEADLDLTEEGSQTYGRVFDTYGDETHGRGAVAGDDDLLTAFRR